jgi:hypothetical protein
MLFISACQNNNQAGYDLRKDKSAPNYMSNPMKGNDVTNQNPNFLDLHGTRNGAASSGSGNTGVDVNKAKQVIGKTNEFRTDSVWINGDRMWVNVYKKGMLTDQAKIDAEARLHKKLTKALPRYNIEVRVQEDRR